MFKKLALTTALVAAMTSGASAQTWDAPTFFAPRALDDLGLYYFKTDRAGQFDDSNGLKVIWRQSGNLNLGVHAGTGDIENIGESIVLGAELYGPLAALSGSTGLAMSWNLGIGAGFGDLGDDVSYVDFSVPLGVSIGLSLGTGSFNVTPYVHPRVSLDVAAVTIADQEETETNVGFAVDLGADVNLGPRFLIRGSASLGDRDAFGIGIAMRAPRRISAR
jgi:hypothetical protein